MNAAQTKQWYMITTISGKEEQVIESLKNRMISENMEGVFEDFRAMMVPTISAKEYAKKLNNEKYKVKQKNLYTGYIFIKMDMTNEAWFMVRNTQYVTGLVGSSGQRTKPTPISEAQFQKMVVKANKIIDDFKNDIISSPFKQGMLVEITDGPNKGETGTITEVNDQKEVATVEIILFERKTPVTISYKAIKIKD